MRRKYWTPDIFSSKLKADLQWRGLSQWQQPCRSHTCATPRLPEIWQSKWIYKGNIITKILTLAINYSRQILRWPKQNSRLDRIRESPYCLQYSWQGSCWSSRGPCTWWRRLPRSHWQPPPQSSAGLNSRGLTDLSYESVPCMRVDCQVEKGCELTSTCLHFSPSAVPPVVPGPSLPRPLYQPEEQSQIPEFVKHS